MMATLNSFEIGVEWVDLNDLSGVAVGTEVLLQCTGKPGDAVELAISDTEPVSGFIGVRLQQDRPMKRIPLGVATVWARYVRVDDTTPAKLVTTIQVQELTAITDFLGPDTGSDFSVDVAIGKKPGYSQSAVVMRNPSCSNTEFTDVWAGGGNMSLAEASETWEISSDNANDINTGTGAWSVLISSLDDTKTIQSPQVVNLNGTNWVTIPGTHFRPHNLAATRGAFVLSAGSEESNIGTLTIRDTVTQQARMVITPQSGINEDGQITAPTGFTLLALKVLISWPKNESGEVYNSIKPDGADTARISSGRLPIYQNILDLNFQAKFKTSEKTDRSFRAKATNLGSELTIIQEFLVIENDAL